jgi:hypothetical protein
MRRGGTFFLVAMVVFALALAQDTTATVSPHGQNTGNSTRSALTGNTFQVSPVPMASSDRRASATAPVMAAVGFQNGRPATSENSPQPTNVLPLLGLLGLGSLIAGLIVRR